LLSEGLINELKCIFDSLRDEDYGVSLRIMVMELQQLLPDVIVECSECAINGLVYHLLWKWDSTWHQGTYKAQNNHHSSKVIVDFLEHF
jgi:hypothetical protein